MFIVILLMFTGILVGFLLQKRSRIDIHKIITVLIWVLLFLLGIEVGGNRRIMDNLATLGLQALVITLAVVLGSCVAAWGLSMLLNKKDRRRTNEG